jgi:hypothetical protein
MINPSIPGWIDKFFIEKKAKNQLIIDEDLYYENLRATGFLYGNILDSNPNDDLLSSEISKVAFLEALFGIYKIAKKNDENFIENCNLFFEKIKPQRYSILKKILPKGTKSVVLEKNIEDRVSLNDNILSKNLSHFSTNAFLFIDILAFQKFIEQDNIPDNYFKKIETTIISVITLALKSKSSKSTSDELMIKFFESSIRYNKLSEITISSIEQLKLEYLTTNLEKKYCIDMACLTFWSDQKMENNEIYFLHKLSEILQIDNAFVYTSIKETDDLISKNILQLPYFNTENPFKNYYNQTNQKVTTLILRNKNRLVKEMQQSKELMQLLAVSTRRDLDQIEKKKVKNQLLDICKTIPTLTIFLIPGGSLLLPILIKFIPQLLPSAFNENFDENE